ncbi:hypothetical protein AMECASPLE_039111 [Ameca splendens]|uniref:Uncharacterized protein n=1 Tax=Ameca splendens TaxID=208324 RepID=A0ABV0XXF1_9TELE
MNSNPNPKNALAPMNPKMNFPHMARTQILNTCPRTQTPLISSPQHKGIPPQVSSIPEKPKKPHPHSASSTHTGHSGESCIDLAAIPHTEHAWSDSGEEKLPFNRKKPPAEPGSV